MNWRNIEKDGYPTNDNKYLVTDGVDISTSDVNGTTFFTKTGIIFKFHSWVGDDNTWEDGHGSSGIPMFDMIPTHWCPIDEIELPK
jgi:hypothetical protein